MAKRDRRIASLKKETIRKLAADDLGKVQGGVLEVRVVGGKLPYTAACLTQY